MDVLLQFDESLHYTRMTFIKAFCAYCFFTLRDNHNDKKNAIDRRTAIHCFSF